MESEPAGIAAAAERAHQLLDLLIDSSPGGLFRVERMAVDLQIARPGPARDALAALLDPLDSHPELSATLRAHVATDFDRRRTADSLRVHPNTVDYRMKKIAQLTGHDPASGAGMWYLRAALTARGHLAPTTSTV